MALPTKGSYAPAPRLVSYTPDPTVNGPWTHTRPDIPLFRTPPAGMGPSNPAQGGGGSSGQQLSYGDQLLASLASQRAFKNGGINLPVSGIFGQSKERPYYGGGGMTAPGQDVWSRSGTGRVFLNGQPVPKSWWNTKRLEDPNYKGPNARSGGGSYTPAPGKPTGGYTPAPTRRPSGAAPIPEGRPGPNTNLTRSGDAAMALNTNWTSPTFGTKPSTSPTTAPLGGATPTPLGGMRPIAEGAPGSNNLTGGITASPSAMGGSYSNTGFTSPTMGGGMTPSPGGNTNWMPPIAEGRPGPNTNYMPPAPGMGATPMPGGYGGGMGATPTPGYGGQGNAWGRMFRQQYGQAPGQMRDQWNAYRQQNGIGGYSSATRPDAPQAMGSGSVRPDFRQLLARALMRDQ